VNGSAAHKSVKYTDIETNYTFQPTAIESLGPINMSGRDFFYPNLVSWLQAFHKSGNDRETSFVFQRLSILIQHFDAILLDNSFVKKDE